MSLRIWMPLDGNIKNYGASTVITMNSNATVDTSGKIGSCYVFNNSDSYISIDSEDLRKIFTGGSRPFSFALWVYRADSTRAILFGDYSLPGNINLNLELKAGYDNTVRFYWTANPDYTFTGSTVPLTTWTHIAVTYSGTELKCYINGVLVNTRTGTLATKNKTSGAFYLGRDSRTGSTTLNGKLNDFRVYDHCLSLGEVKEISKALVLYYPLSDAIVGNKVVDCSGYNRHGTITASTCPTIISGSPRNSNCYQFDGTDDVIISSVKQTDILSDKKFTISAWVYLTEFKNNRGVLGPHEDNYCGICFCQADNANRISLSFGNGSSWCSVRDTGYVLNTWAHYVMTYDGAKTIAYRNGVKLGESSGSVVFAANNITIGRAYNDSTRYWKGKISDVKIYATALSANDILKEYHRFAGIHKNYAFTTNEFVEDGLNKTSIGINGVTTGNLIEGDYSKVLVSPDDGNIQSTEFIEII